MHKGGVARFRILPRRGLSYFRGGLSNVGVVFQNVGDTITSVPRVGALSHVSCAPISREDKSQRLLRTIT